MGKGTAIRNMVRNANQNAKRAWDGVTIPEADYTPGRSRFDQRAMIHDLQYLHADNVATTPAQNLRMRHVADLKLVGTNLYDLFDMTDPSLYDKVQHLFSIPAFLLKIAGEQVAYSFRHIGRLLEPPAPGVRGRL